MPATKTLRDVEIKDDGKGTVEAIFATFGVVDRDGDVTLPGAFRDGAPVIISNYGHTSWKGAMPVGKGRIRLTSTEAIMQGRFFLDTSHGGDAFRTVKAMGELQEWSYSLEGVKSRAGEQDGQRVRFLESVHVHEVSPVLKGAGIGTRTLAVKHAPLDLTDLEREYLRFVCTQNEYELRRSR